MSLDRFWSTTGDARLRPPGRYAEPGELDTRRAADVADRRRAGRRRGADGACRPCPTRPPSRCTRPVDDRASVAFQGQPLLGRPGDDAASSSRCATGSAPRRSRSSRPPGSCSCPTIWPAPERARWCAPPSTGPRSKQVVLSQFSTARPCDRKANKPPGEPPWPSGHACSGQRRPSRRVDLEPWPRSSPWPSPANRWQAIGMSESSEYQKLRAHLAFLRMTAAAEALPGAARPRRKAKLTTRASWNGCSAVEVSAVDERRRASLARFASLPSPFTLADFDFSAQPSVDKKLIDELGTLRFVEDATNVLLIGPPGVGKTMLAVGLGHAAVAAGMRTYYTTAADLAARCHRAALEGRWATTMRFYAGPRLLIIDEVGYLPLPGRGRRRAVPGCEPEIPEGQHRSDDQPRDRQLGQGLQRRPHGRRRHAGPPLHRSVVINIDGDSYRMRSHRARAEAARRGRRPP